MDRDDDWRLPDECEQREHHTTTTAWADYERRVLELEMNGFVKDSEAATESGLRWVCELSRGQEGITVSIARSGELGAASGSE